MKINVNMFFSLLFYVLSFCFGFLNNPNIALVFSIVASVFFIFYARSTVLGYSSAIFIFVFFSIVYGLSGPITQLWGEGISPIYTHVFSYSKYFFAFSLAQIGLIIGITIFISSHQLNSIVDERKKLKIYNKVNFFKNSAFFLLVLGSLFQVINTLRVGGIKVIFMQKAIYQAAEANLSLTLPADSIIQLAVTCISLFICFSIYCNKKINKTIFIRYLIVSIPYLLVILLLGQRGKLIGIFLTFFFGITFLKPLKKLSINVIFLGIIAYLIMVFLYVNRGIVELLQTDSSMFFEQVIDIDRYGKYLNPGSSEFSCTFGNFNEFFVKGHYEFKYGKSYIQGLALAVPSFLYPGRKPIQITYEFRNRYFYSESKRSNIAGTAFSSILEAYWNFGYLGIIFVYLLFGYFIMYLDFSFSKKNIFNGFFLVYIVSVFLSFSRVQLGDVISNIILRFIYFFVFILLPYFIYCRILDRYKNID